MDDSKVFVNGRNELKNKIKKLRNPKGFTGFYRRFPCN